MENLSEALLKNPGNKALFRAEGGRFEYGDPIPLILDLMVVRRIWPDATILANDDQATDSYGYLAFWEPDKPTLDFVLPRSIVIEHPSAQVRDLFGPNRPWILNFVELEGAKKLDMGVVEDTRVSLLDRLLQDDEPLWING